MVVSATIPVSGGTTMTMVMLSALDTQSELAEQSATGPSGRFGL